MIEKFDCGFCHRSFSRESLLINHMCEAKRRWMQKDERHAQMAFYAWRRWHQIAKTARSKFTEDDFIKSQEYIQFVKFGRHIINVNLINPNMFIDFVIKHSLKLKDWTKDSVYELYTQQLCNTEDIETALERFVKLAMDWAEETDNEWNEFFIYISPSRAVHWIRTGRISPWVFLNAESYKQLYSRMDEEQRMRVESFVDLKRWKIKLTKQAKDAKVVQDILKDYQV